MSRAARLIVAFFMGFLCLIPAYAEARKNVVFVIVDALRADYLEGTRNGVPLMPYVNSLSAVRFKNATSPASWTLPGVASLLTSRYVDAHGVFAAGSSLPANVQSMAAWFKEAGYATIGIQTNGNLTAGKGFDQGFDLYADLTANDGAPAETVTAQALAATEAPGQPFFLYVHYIDPHITYDPPENYCTLLGYPNPALSLTERPVVENFRPYFQDHLAYVMGKKPAREYPELSALGRDAVRTHYDGEARYADDQVRVLLEGILGRFPETIVVITSDHGEHFWEHNYLGHVVSVYEPLMHVPLVIKAPGLAPAEVNDLVSTVDVLPTFADMLGLPAKPWTWQGQSLFAAHNPQGPVFSCAKDGPTYQLDLHMARLGSIKLICNRRTGALELYNLAPDPGETANLAPQQPALAGQMLDMLNIHLREDARLHGSGGVVLWAEWPGGAVEEGHPIHFVAPEGVGYVWFKDGQPLHDAIPHRTGEGTQSLSIDAAASGDAGSYECMYSDSDQNLHITEPYVLAAVVPPGELPVFGVGTAAALVVFFAGLGCMLLRTRGSETPGIH